MGSARGGTLTPDNLSEAMAVVKACDVILLVCTADVSSSLVDISTLVSAGRWRHQQAGDVAMTAKTTVVVVVGL